MKAPATVLTVELASRFSGIALSHLTREYPNKLDHIMNDAADLRSPRELHPVFFGSFDWHSCVHGYWLLATLLRHFPALEAARQIEDVFDAQLTPEKVRVEVAYLEQPLRGTFERPYGWAWLLMLDAELSRHTTASAKRWRDSLSPLTAAFVERYARFLPKATYPVRVGTHFNSAFALALGLEYANAAGDAGFRQLLVDKARLWYGADRDCQAWEPGGDDFLSPALIEALCMQRALSAGEFTKWMSSFLPHLSDGKPATLFTPATVSDRSDGKIAHLDGMNLSRAWCWSSLAKSWPPHDVRRRAATGVAEQHLAASLPHVAGEYMGEHWLATFALLALTEQRVPPTS